MRIDLTSTAKERDDAEKASSKGIGTEFWRAVANVVAAMTIVGGLGFLLFPSGSTESLVLGAIGIVSILCLCMTCACIGMQSMMIAFGTSKTCNGISSELQERIEDAYGFPIEIIDEQLDELLEDDGQENIINAKIPVNVRGCVEKMSDGTLSCDVSLWVKQIERDEDSDILTSYAEIMPGCLCKAKEDTNARQEESGMPDDAETEAR